MVNRFESKYCIYFYIIGFLFMYSCAEEKKELSQDFPMSLIVFESYIDGKSKIFTMEPDGSGIKQLTKNDYNNHWPR